MVFATHPYVPTECPYILKLKTQKRGKGWNARYGLII